MYETWDLKVGRSVLWHFKGAIACLFILSISDVSRNLTGTSYLQSSMLGLGRAWQGLVRSELTYDQKEKLQICLPAATRASHVWNVRGKTVFKEWKPDMVTLGPGFFVCCYLSIIEIWISISLFVDTIRTTSRRDGRYDRQKLNRYFGCCLDHWQIIKSLECPSRNAFLVGGTFNVRGPTVCQWLDWTSRPNDSGLTSIPCVEAIVGVVGPRNPGICWTQSKLEETIAVETSTRRVSTASSHGGIQRNHWNVINVISRRVYHLRECKTGRHLTCRSQRLKKRNGRLPKALVVKTTHVDTAGFIWRAGFVQ